MANLEISVESVKEEAIYHDKSAIECFRMWKEDGCKEHDIYYLCWHEHLSKSKAMLELLDMIEEGTHVVMCGEVVVL